MEMKTKTSEFPVRSNSFVIYSKLRESHENIEKELNNFKRLNNRNGDWLDEIGCCKVCNGELPYGHTENCDIYKMEKQIRDLESKNKELQKKLDAADIDIKSFFNFFEWVYADGRGREVYPDFIEVGNKAFENALQTFNKLK